MRRAADRLLHLAELRRGIAERAVARAEAELRAANGAVAEAEAAAEARRRQLAAQADGLRHDFAAAPQVAAALGELWESLRGFDAAAAEAGAAVDAARAARDAARDALAEARAALVRAHRTVEKRRLMRAPLVAAEAARAERRDEQELEDRPRPRAAAEGVR